MWIYLEFVWTTDIILGIKQKNQDNVWVLTNKNTSSTQHSISQSFYRNEYSNGIISVRQLFKNNGHLFNYCECINYYKIPVTGKELTFLVALFNFCLAIYLLSLSPYILIS